MSDTTRVSTIRTISQGQSDCNSLEPKWLVFDRPLDRRSLRGARILLVYGYLLAIARP